MELCGLPKARPITCSDCPAFQRLHSSVLCAAESATRFPWVIHTTFEQKFYIRWCCIDPLRPPDLPGLIAHVAWTLSSMSFLQQVHVRLIPLEQRRQEIH